MDPLLYFVKLVTSFMFTSNNYPAVIFDLPTWNENGYYITTCPASTKQEKEINDRVSLTGNSVFLRNFHGSNTTLKICDKPVEPGILYNLKSKLYEIGYELCYYEQDKLKWEDDVNLTQLYRRVNITGNYEVIHNDTNKNLILNDGASKLNSHWEPVLSVAYVGDNKQIQLSNMDFREKAEMMVTDDELQGKCENDNLRNIDMKIYVSSENDSNSNKSQNTTSPNLEQLKPWDGQSYGSLVMSQLIPLWYYTKNSSKAASCSPLNTIPVWKSIAGQLKKVDLFLQAVIRKIFMHNVKTILFGASGVLTLKNGTDIGENQRKKIYLLQNDTNYRQIIPIPKIIYRVVEAFTFHHDVKYYAAIVIHNDPIHVLDSEKICKESQQLSGWERIKNDDPKTGLTYVCPFNEFIKSVPILPGDGQLRTEVTEEGSELQLDSIDYCSPSSGSDYILNETIAIVPEFEKLFNITAQGDLN